MLINTFKSLSNDFTKINIKLLELLDVKLKPEKTGQNSNIVESV